MTYYCCECSEWLRSRDVKMSYHNGRYVEHRWCEYDRAYRASDQNVYSCSGFVYVRRAVITKICEILKINPSVLFQYFDTVKENYLMKVEPEKMVNYNSIASYIVEGIDNHPQKEVLAKMILDSYIIDAEAKIKMQKYSDAVNIYSEMIKVLHIMFDIINDRSFYHKLVK